MPIAGELELSSVESEVCDEARYAPRALQTGALNTIVVLSLNDEMPEDYQKACDILASYGFRRSVDKDKYRDIDLPRYVWVASRVDLLDTFRDAVLERMRGEGVQVKAIFVGKLDGYAMSGPCFF